MQKSLKDSTVTDFAKDKKIKIPSKSTREPNFKHSTAAGERDFVAPGNKDFMPGDQIAKPKRGQSGQSGKEASDSGEFEEDFEFTLSQEELLDIFFDDLELPNLVKTALRELKSRTFTRAGFTMSGSPNNINLVRTMRNSFGRRLAMRRPKISEVEALHAEVAALQAKGGDEERINALLAEIDRLEKKRQWVPFLDPVDVRYNAFIQTPKPTTQAVMFCLMDVSGSMGEREKDLAKRFFMLLQIGRASCRERV